MPYLTPYEIAYFDTLEETGKRWETFTRKYKGVSRPDAVIQSMNLGYWDGIDARTKAHNKARRML